MLRDLRHGVRVLLQAKGWSTVIVLSLAVGIGANAAIFTAVNGLLLRKLPVKDPDSLVRLRSTGRNDMSNDSSDYGYSAREEGNEPVRATFSYPMYQHFRSANQTLSDLAASAPLNNATVTIDQRAETATAFMASGNYFTLLGVSARIGRTITSDDDRASAEPVAMLSERYWRSRFASDANAIGRSIRINDIPVTIVGVLPAEFVGTHRPAGVPRDLWLPITFDARNRSRVELQEGADQGLQVLRLNDPTIWWVQITGRLKPGVSLDQVKGNLGGVFQHQARASLDSYLASLTPELRNRSDNQGRTGVPRLLAESGSRGTYDADSGQTSSLGILGAVVALVLLLVCANVANLLLARATSRQREISVRLSMGAGRFRVIRQLLTESLLLAGLGGILGIAIARWGQPLLPPPVGTSIPADWRFAAFTSGMTVLAGLIFGIAPALRATSLDIGKALKEDSRSIAGTNTVLARTLLVVQVSISLVLMMGAGLFLRTLENLRQVDVGFDPQNLVVIRVNVDGSSLDMQRRFRFFQEGIERLQTVPGVIAATVSDPILMSGNESTTALYVEGRAYPRGREGYSAARDEVYRVLAGPNYFKTVGMSLIAGRSFDERDHQHAPEVAIINEAAARKFFPNENPVGKRFGESPDRTNQFEVTGLVRDVRYNRLREQPPPTWYMPYLQKDPDDLAFSVRTAVDPGSLMNALRTAVSEVDPSVPIARLETQTSLLEGRFVQEKVLAQGYILFGAIAVFVAAIGLFGLLSYGVARRTREIGIRMAMGAQRGTVLRLVLRESLFLVGIGIVLGVAGTFGAGRLIQSQLFGLEPTDTMTMVSAVLLLIVVSAAAGYLPARRATRVDPMIALRYE
jgi:predicted permease